MTSAATRPTFTFGPTLARPWNPDRAERYVQDRRPRRGKGSISIYVFGTDRAAHFDIDAVVHDISAEHALDALAIAAARIGFVHRLAPSRAPAIGADEEPALRLVAERLVDKTRSFGWWERTCNEVQRWFGAAATFRIDRETCIREVMREMTVWRERAARDSRGENGCGNG